MLLLGGDARIPGGGGDILGVRKYGQIAVGFQDGVLYGLDIQHVLFPQMSHQLVQGDPGPAQIVRENFAVVDENHRLAAQQAAQEHTAQNQPRQHQFHPQHRENGHQTGVEGNRPILHGNGGQVGYQHGHHKFRRLHLPDLPLAHEPDGENQHQVQQQGSQIGKDQKNHLFWVSFPGGDFL